MDNIDEAQAVLAEVRNIIPGTRGTSGPGIENPHPFGCREAVVDLSVRGFEAVGETGEEAGGGQEEEEEEGEGAGGGVARAVAGEDWCEELEG